MRGPTTTRGWCSSQQKPELSVPSLESALAVQPRDLFTRYHLGVSHFLLKDYDKADPLISEVYAEQPRLENVGFYTGFLQYQRKSYSDALTAFSQVQATDPDMRQLIGFYKGLTLGNLGLSERAVTELDEALKIQTSEPFSAPVERMRDTLTAAKTTEKRFRASLGFGGFYSDNVALNPNRSGDTFAELLRAQWPPVASDRRGVLHHSDRGNQHAALVDRNSLPCSPLIHADDSPFSCEK